MNNKTISRQHFPTKLILMSTPAMHTKQSVLIDEPLRRGELRGDR